MNESSNKPEDLLSEQDLNLYYSLEYPFNLSILHKALKAKLELDPEYEVWVPFVYYGYIDKQVLKPYKMFISSKGRVWSFKKNKHTGRLIPWMMEEYPRLMVDNGKQRNKVPLHRALACSFVPLEIPGHPKDLQVNHMDGVKSNFDLFNLEWTTGQGNVRHARETGLLISPVGIDHYAVKPVKGVVVAGEFKGYSFVICGKKEAEASGFDATRIFGSVGSGFRKHKSCQFSMATPEDLKTLPHGLNDEVKNNLFSINPYVTTKLLATHIETGEQIVIVGRKELKNMNFHRRLVADVIAQKRSSYKGYTFERIPL